jgi:DNA-binding MarR family transcriptional regulator
LPPFETIELDDPQLLSSAAAEIYRMRRARDRHMPVGLVGEPAWDILLALYSEEPAKLPVSTVCYGSGTPPTTALRWIGVLERRCLLERANHHKDGRIVLLSLTPEGRLIVERCLKEMLRAART